MNTRPIDGNYSDIRLFDESDLNHEKKVHIEIIEEFDDIQHCLKRFDDTVDSIIVEH